MTGMRFWRSEGKLAGRLLALMWSCLVGPWSHGVVVDFEDLGLAPGAYESGSDLSGSFASAGITLNNGFTDWGDGVTSWDGFAYTAVGGASVGAADIAAGTFSGYQYQSAAGGAASGDIFVVGYVNSFGLTPTVTLPAGLDTPQSVRVTNNLYTWASMTYGDAFAKEFGGPDGTDPDWLRLTITGYDDASGPTGAVEYYLADFRGPADEDTIVSTWAEVDLSALGSGVSEIRFTLDSSDTGEFGMNTPAYFAIDDLAVVPEPAAGALLAGAGAFAIALFLRRGRRKGA